MPKHKSRLARLFLYLRTQINPIEVLLWSVVFWLVAFAGQVPGQSLAPRPTPLAPDAAVLALVPAVARLLNYSPATERPEVAFAHTLRHGCDCAPRGLYSDNVVHLRP